jgi:hypothetical protein
LFLTIVAKNDPLSLTPLAASQDSVVKSVIWDSAPQVRERFSLTGSSLTALVTGFEDKSLVLGAQKIGSGQAFVLAAFLDSNTNTELQQWPYFTGIIYSQTGFANWCRLPLPLPLGPVQ